MISTHPARARDRLVRLLAVGLAVCLSAAPAAAGEAGRVTYVEGRVDRLLEGGTASRPVRAGESVRTGDVVRTKSGSRAEITFVDESVIRMAPASKITIEAYQTDEDGRRREAAVRLHRGKVRAIIAKGSDPADFRILTPNAEGTITGSEIFAFYQAGNTGLLVSSGNLRVINPQLPQVEPVVVTPGQSLVVPPEGAPGAPREFLELEREFHIQDTRIPPPSAREDLTVMEGLVSEVSGSVSLLTAGQGPGRPARLQDVIRQGDVLVTGPDGRITVKFDNGNALQLKPDTRLRVREMSVDPVQQRYDALFGVARGEVRAIVETIRNDSRFRVRTPQAVCGVRGTVMYVKSRGSRTDVIFEGGPGFIRSQISGEEKEVGMGEGAYAEDSGFVSDPYPVSESERLTLALGWSAQGEGYTPPRDGSELIVFDNLALPSGPDEGPVEPAPDPAPPVPDPPPPEPEDDDDVVLTGAGLSGPGDTADDAPPSGALSGNVDGSGNFNPDPIQLNAIGSFTGAVATTGLPRPGEPEPAMTVSGTVTRANPDEPNFLAAGITGTSPDGSILRGTIFGTDDPARAAMVAHYFRSDGEGGYLTGYLRSADLAGTFDPLSGEIELAGTLEGFREQATPFAPSVLADEANLQGDTLPGGFTQLRNGNPVFGEINDLRTTAVPGSDFALFSTDLSGVVNSPPGEDWSVKTGGAGLDRYWIGDLGGGAWLGDGDFAAALTGGTMDEQRLGTLQGDVLGLWDETAGTWQAISAGAVTYESLSFNGQWNSSSAVISPDSGFSGPGFFGTLQGLMGGTEGLFAADSPVRIMGAFQFPPDGIILLTQDFSPGVVDLIDGGDSGARFSGNFNGFGVSDNEDTFLLDGLWIAPYVRSTAGGNEAGYLISDDLSGEAYASLGLFEMEGSLNHVVRGATAHAPSEIFSGSPTLTASRSIVYPSDGLTAQDHTFRLQGFRIVDQDWDVWTLTADLPLEETPPPDWEVVFDGSWTQGDEVAFSLLRVSDAGSAAGRLTGEISGRGIRWTQGTLDGTFFTDEGLLTARFLSDRWIGAGVGAGSVHQPLQAMAAVNGASWDFIPGIGLVNSVEQVTAVAGTTAPLFDAAGNPEFVFIGLSGEGNTAWSFSGRTDDGAATLRGEGGFLQLPDNRRRGLAAGFTIRPDDDGSGFLAGALQSGEITGRFYPDLVNPPVAGGGLFEADGEFQIALEAPTVWTPDQLLDGSALATRLSTEARIFSGHNGMTGELEVRNDDIRDQGWGTFSARGAGTSIDPGFSEFWEATLGGWTDRGLDQGAIPQEQFFVGRMLGSNLPGGEFDGGVTGEYLTIDSYGSFLGDVIGRYEEDPAGTWLSWTSGLTRDDADLTSSGDLFAGIRSFGQRGSGQDGLHGLLGVTDPLWDDGSAAFVSIGRLDMADPGRFVWHSAPGMELDSVPGNPPGAFYSSNHNPGDLQYVTYSDGGGGIGAFYGFTSGVGDVEGIRGLAIGMYVDPQGNGGLLRGDLTGELFELGEDTSDLYQLEGLLTLGPAQPLAAGLDPVALWSSVERQRVDQSPGSGAFFVGGVPGPGVEIDGFSALATGIAGQTWGVFSGGMHGRFDQSLTDEWGIRGLTGTLEPGGVMADGTVAGSWLGRVNGTPWAGNELDGSVDVIWIALRQDGTLSGRRMDGEAVGQYVEVEEEGMWQAAHAGEWVEVESLLDLADLPGAFLDEVPEVPVTEVYTSVLSGNPDPVFNGVDGMVNFYADGAGASAGIWAGLFEGQFTGPVPEDWELVLSGPLETGTPSGSVGELDVRLTGSQWSDGFWKADVTGQGTDGGTAVNLTGRAAGTFDPSAQTFQGGGTGTWNR